ncbi:uncharacterized protein [Diabrotica undecimpunctata]|uniref:uncharacterized protein n=1 Tax=Diabrotica undecimpunctata TaxID=50387 RepID=UPI003B632EA3
MSSGKNKWKDNYDRNRPLTIQELEAAIEEIQNETEIDAVIIPPDVDELTDEEEIDDDLLEGHDKPQDTAGTFELMAEDNKNEFEDNYNEPSTSQATLKRAKSVQYNPNWSKRDPVYSNFPESQEHI